MKSGGSEEYEISGINVTPLVDIMLVLLIIFMLTAHLIAKQAIEIELPRAAQSTSLPPTTLAIALKADGALFLNDKPVTPAALREAIRAAVARDPKTQAVIAQKLIHAPFDGVLGIRQVEAGQYVNPGGAIVTLTDLSNLYVNFTLPEQSRAQIAVDQTVQIAVDAYPDRSFEAKITAVEPQVSADTRTIKVQATMSNPEHLLLPGMFADVRVVLPPAQNIVTVPETAVDYTLYGDSVFVLTPNGAGKDGKPIVKATRTFVRTGERFANRVAILEGLKPGDLVAASGQLKLINGASVVVTASEALTPPETAQTN